MKYLQIWRRCRLHHRRKAMSEILATPEQNVSKKHKKRTVDDGWHTASNSANSRSLHATAAAKSHGVRYRKFGFALSGAINRMRNYSYFVYLLWQLLRMEALPCLWLLPLSCS
jgi:hypothetical protein